MSRGDRAFRDGEFPSTGLRDPIVVEVDAAAGEPRHHLTDDITVRAQHGGCPDGLDARDREFWTGAFAQRIIELDSHSDRLADGTDGLDTTDIWAAHDGRNARVAKQCGNPVSLAPTFLRQGAFRIVDHAAGAGIGVAHEVTDRVKPWHRPPPAP